MIKTASLRRGVLLKLYEDMKTEDNSSGSGSEDEAKPVLLQIRSIIPVLEEGGLWPNRGFFLKVSDSTHALYVALSDEQNEMVLGNKLKLGQLIHAQRLEKADPVPVLRGVSPLPGRRPCDTAPLDILSPAGLVRFLEASAVDCSVVEKGVILEKKVPRSQRKVLRVKSDSESISSKLQKRSLRTARARKETVAKEKLNLIAEDFDKDKCVENDSDTDSSSLAAKVAKRRSWSQSEFVRVKDIFYSSSSKLPPPRRGSGVHVSPLRSSKYGSSDENSSSASVKVAASSSTSLIKSSDESQGDETTVEDDDHQVSNSLCCFVPDRTRADANISWNALSPELVKLGKEMRGQRDIAMAAAVEALQEACVAERLLNSLSTLSQFNLAVGDDDLESYVDKFFGLQDDLSRTKSILQSHTSSTQETDPCNDHSFKEGLERHENATAWIRSAVALDLSQCPFPSPSSNQPNNTNTTNKSGPSSYSSRPTCTAMVMNNIPLISASADKDLPEWNRGSIIRSASSLTALLQDECRMLFLNNVEKYLDEVERKVSCMESDGQFATMMCKVKRVSDCLDMVVKKQEKASSSEGEIGVDETELEAYRRVRNKIYGILLKHVERTAMALERFNASV